MPRYRVYGLVVQSAYPIGPVPWEADPSHALAADIELVRGSASAFSKVYRALEIHANGNEPWFRHFSLPDGREYLRWPSLFEFLIAEDGRRIIGRALREVPRETFQTYLFGQVLSFALLKCGIEPLHATSVVMDGKAIAFLGDCGYGKSTLAAACLKRGYSLLTDDQLVLREEGAQVIAYPGPPRIKLMPAVARRLMGSGADGFPLNPLTSKRIISLTAAQYANSPMPLKAIYVLRFPRSRSNPRVATQRLSDRAAWYELTRGTFNPVLHDPDRLKTQFVWACQLAERIPVKSLSYPGTLQALPRVVEALASDVAS